jgi:EmrB/QacA subfamily drug resistance transporter
MSPRSALAGTPHGAEHDGPSRSDATTHESRRDPAGPGVPRGAGVILAIVVITQLMIVLDASIVNLSLTALRADLGVSSATLAWVVNAYALAFGGLLLLGGRLGDGLGRRRVFASGVALFTMASLGAGLSSDTTLLIAARALQGTGAAVAAPSGLAILMATFPEGPARTRALGLFFAMSAAGGALGLLVGGTLTSAFSWRAAFLINVPVGVVVVAGAVRLLPAFPGRRLRFDVAGAVSGTLGISALVFAFIRVGEDGWGDAAGLGAFAATVVLVTTVVLAERRATDPLLPLRLLTRPSTAAGYATMTLITAVLFGTSFLLPQYLQLVRGMEPAVAGVAFLPMPILIFAGSRSVGRIVERTSARAVVLTGLVSLVAAGAWLSQLSADTHYFPGVFGPLALVGLGGGLLFLPLSTLILSGVPATDAGAASGALQTSQQVGGALGVAILTSVLAASAGTATGPVDFSAGVAHAFVATAALAVLAAVIFGLQRSTPSPEE